MSTLKPGDRVWHRTRAQLGVYTARVRADRESALVDFGDGPEQCTAAHLCPVRAGDLDVLRAVADAGRVVDEVSPALVLSAVDRVTKKRVTRAVMRLDEAGLAEVVDGVWAATRAGHVLLAERTD